MHNILMTTYFVLLSVLVAAASYFGLKITKEYLDSGPK